MSFEQGGFSVPRKEEQRSESREPEGFPDLDKALAIAEKRVFQYAIDPNDFAKPNGPYEKEHIQSDLEYANRMEQTFKKQNLANATPGARAQWEAKQKVGKVFEAIVLFNGDSNEWFGENAQMIIPSRYDDIVHGVDGIVEFEEEKNRFNHLALGIDVTTSADVNRKFKRIFDDIDKGELTKISYFHSERQNIKKEKRDIPRVVVGADRQTIHELISLWHDRKNNAFAEHPMQIQMLEEIAHQLGMFSVYADKKGQSSIAEIYRRDLAIIQDILMKKQESFGEDKVKKMRSVISKDLVYQEIMRLSA